MAKPHKLWWILWSPATSFSKELTPNDYQWRVRAENSGYTTAFSTQSFLVESTDDVDISETIVVLLAPADAVSFGPTDTINFSWDPVLNAETYSFQIAIPSFENATEIIKNETTIATTFSVSNLAVNSYEWRVRALNPTFKPAIPLKNSLLNNKKKHTC